MLLDTRCISHKWAIVNIIDTLFQISSSLNRQFHFIFYTHNGSLKISLEGLKPRRYDGLVNEINNDCVATLKIGSNENQVCTILPSPNG